MSDSELKRLPPFGRALSERLKWNNPPPIVVVCAGADAWTSARFLNETYSDIPAMVLPANESEKRYGWPVRNCIVKLEWSQGPSESDILNLVKQLLRDGAQIVNVTAKSRIIAKYWPEEK